MTERTRRFEVGGFSELLRLYTEGLYDRFKQMIIPTNAGWASALSGSGTAYQAPIHLDVGTGTTALSSALLRSLVTQLNSGDISRLYVDWRKRLELSFRFMRLNSDPEFVGRIQLKEASSEGALAERGIGIEIQNLDVYGEGYGTSRGTTSLGSIPNDRVVRVRLVLGEGVLEFWINGVLKGKLSGNHIPSVQGTARAYVVISAVNGATGGVDGRLTVGGIKIVQEWCSHVRAEV